MFLISLSLSLGLISMASGAAFVPVRQAKSPASAPSNCASASITTIYVPTTVYSPPETITIALENITSVSESLSSAASVDTAQVSAANEAAPVSEAVPSTLSKFTHTIVAPLIEGTIGTNSSSGVYYVSIGQNTTNWSYTPTQSTVVGTTTVTVSPLPTRSSTSGNSTTAISTTTHITRTTTRSGSAITLPTGGIPAISAPYPRTNRTDSSTFFASAAWSGTPSVSYNTTVTLFTTVATTTVNVTAYSTTISIANATQTVNSKSTCTESALGFSGTNVTWENINVKRQVCTLVYATISGNLASWCNNWDGHTVFHHSTYTSTLTPSQYATETSHSATSSPLSSKTTNSLSEASPITVTIESTAAPTQVSASALTTSPSSTFAAPAAATSCGQVGVFEINFDGLPQYSPPNNDTASYPPIFNPYEHFFWGNGWAYGPPPTEPFPPESGDHLAEFVPSLANNDTNSPDASTVPDSAFGAGPRAYNNNYWFSPLSVYVGCDNGATDPSVTCDFVATAYQWDPVNYKEKVVATEHFPQPPCPGFENCTLTQIFFDSRFTMLSSLSFYANVEGLLKIFWIDTMELSWWNNTCAAGLARISAQ